MTLQLDLKPETEQSLRAAAEARQMPVEEYVVSLLEGATIWRDLPSSDPVAVPARDPVENQKEFRQWLDSLGRFSHLMPEYPAGFWTRDVVSDDDRG